LPGDAPDTLLVIVGAGASYDCTEPFRTAGTYDETKVCLPGEQQAFEWRHVRPPLTYQLAMSQPFYNLLAVKYPSAGPVIAELRDRLSRRGSDAPTLEQALADYQRRASRDEQMYQHLMAARFYLRDLIWGAGKFALSPDVSGGVTRYTRLVQRLHEWQSEEKRRLVFVSFNYDLLLESACAQVWGFQWGKRESYVIGDHALILKPHGSVQWEAPDQSLAPAALPVASAAEWTVNHAKNLEPDLKRLWCFNLDSTALTREPAIPVLAMPMAGKSDFLWPPEQREAFDSLKQSVTRVLTLGWRAAEPHFVQLMHSAVCDEHKRMVVTGGRSAENDAVHVHARLDEATGPPLLKHRTITDGFSGLDVDGAHLRWLLE
jgi:hypothetical protein